MAMSGPKYSSYAFWCWKASSVSIMIWFTLRSGHMMICLQVSTNLASMLRVKVGPGLSARMRMSMTALYWKEGECLYVFLRYCRMMRAHSEAASGDDSAASTIAGRKT